MAKARRQSQNSLLMRQIIEQLREFDVDEVEVICNKYKEKKNKKGRRR